MLVDGGLTIPGSAGAEPEKFLREFLGPTLARLEMTFPDQASYRAWFATHPAALPIREPDRLAASGWGR